MQSLRNDDQLYYAPIWNILDSKQGLAFYNYPRFNFQLHSFLCLISNSSSYPFLKLKNIIIFQKVDHNFLAYYEIINIFCFMDLEKQNNKDLGQYFSKFKKYIKRHERSASQISQIQQRLTQQIHEGNLNVNQQQQFQQSSRIRKISKQIRKKNNKFNKELLLLNMSLSESIYSNRQKSVRSSRAKSTRSFASQNIDVSVEQIISYKNKRIDATKRINDLKKLKQQMMKQRQRRQKQKQKKRQKNEYIKKLITQKRQQSLKDLKVEKILQRMKKLQQQRSQRIQKNKNYNVKSSPIIPKYEQIQRQFKMQQRRKQQRLQQIIKKRVQQRQKYNISNIKQHEQKYKQFMKKKRSGSKISLQSKNSQSLEKRQKQFTLKRQNPQKLQQLRARQKRRRIFSQIISQKKQHIKKDLNVGRKFQIAKDKSKFPFKYHYLSKKKNLSDEQIFDNYKEFNFDSYTVQIGNSYLNQVKQQINQSRLKGSSVSIRKRIKTQSQTEKKSYKNYLQDSKRNSRKKDEDQVEKLMRIYGEKSKVIQVLQNNSQIYQANAYKKIAKLKNSLAYTKTLQCERQIDEQFIKSIKQKIKCLQIK